MLPPCNGTANDNEQQDGPHGYSPKDGAGKRLSTAAVEHDAPHENTGKNRKKRRDDAKDEITETPDHANGREWWWFHARRSDESQCYNVLISPPIKELRGRQVH